MEAESENLGNLRSCGFENNRLGTSVARKSALPIIGLGYSSQSTKSTADIESNIALNTTIADCMSTDK